MRPQLVDPTWSIFQACRLHGLGFVIDIGGVYIAINSHTPVVLALSLYERVVSTFKTISRDSMIIVWSILVRKAASDVKTCKGIFLDLSEQKPRLMFHAPHGQVLFWECVPGVDKSGLANDNASRSFRDADNRISYLRVQ